MIHPYLQIEEKSTCLIHQLILKLLADGRVEVDQDPGFVIAKKIMKKF